MPDSLSIAAAIATIVAAAIALAQVSWRVWRRVAARRKKKRQD